MEMLAKDLEGLTERIPEAVTTHLEDLTLEITIDLMGGEHKIAILMPEEYPRGEAMNMDDWAPYRPGHVDAVVQQAVEKLKVRERSTFYSDMTGGTSFSTEEQDDFSQALDHGTVYAAGISIDKNEIEKSREELEHAVAHFKKIHGANIGVLFDEPTKRYTIRLALSLTFLNRFQLESLYLCKTKRLVVELSWAWSFFDASEVPSIKNIFLTTDKTLDQETISDKDDGFGVVKWYLQNRLEQALRLNWLTRKEERKRSEQIGGTDPDGRGLVVEDTIHADDEQELQAAIKKYDLQESDVKEITGKAKMLTNMGWSVSASYMALQENKINVDLASSWLGAASSVTEKAARKTTEEWLSLCKAVKIKQMFAAADCPSDSGFNKSIRFSSPEENFFEGGNTNILNGIARYLKHRMYVITQKCVICDKKLGFECVKTAVCSRPTCGFALEQYGLGCNPLSEIQRSGDLVDLMISLTGVAVVMSSTGNRDSLNPWCENIEVPASYLESSEDLQKYIADCDKSNKCLSFRKSGKNFALITMVLDKIPPISDMAQCASKNKLRGILDARHPLCYPLLQWVLSSNRSHLMAIEPKYHLKGLGSIQYMLCSANPEKEKLFRSKRAKMKAKIGGTGSFWAWHGSGTGNWHAILRLGLKNYSNTAMMSAGAAHGPGIYLARDINTSIGYMRDPRKGWANSSIEKAISCIALCEVVDERAEPKTKCHDHGGVYVVEDEDLVCTRFFFVFPGGYNAERNLQADKLEKPKVLLKLFEE
eukprot:TRINITY_DN24006_c0_g1_i1.p1 TRINITY_DN24006_c0_g1~~TRINITY_DN24006_c0_g1_i1.p1  ORF type:complete len:785 (+),score=125.64 TRINITY_DN24006_c0_g1_i1:66-2357(+)